MINDLIMDILADGHTYMNDLRQRVPGVSWKHVNALRESGVVMVVRGSGCITLTVRGHERVFQSRVPASCLVMQAVAFANPDTMTPEQALSFVRELKRIAGE